MTIEELWHTLEVDATTAIGSAWLTLQATPLMGWPLLVALEPTTRTRALLMPVDRSALPSRNDWPECNGLELQVLAVGVDPHFSIRLRDAGAKEVFASLAEDLAPRIAATVNSYSSISTLFGRLRSWQQFLLAAKVGLSREQERGLWGELYVANEHINPVFGPLGTVNAWKAPTATHQDFQFTKGAVEVKTTASKQPQSVRITSERQLDATGVGELFLHVLVIDEREVSADVEGVGFSLPAAIAKIRASFSLDQIALSTFENKLLSIGYLDIHASRYDVRRYTIRQEYTYRVHGDFPRITESILPVGVGDTSYALSLSACNAFIVETPLAINEIK